MTEVIAMAQRTIDAPRAAVRRALLDYRTVRPRLLSETFSAFHVDEFGVGAGTVFGYRLHAGRRDRDYRMRVSEPDADTIVERDLGSSLVTTWRLAERPGGTAVTVTSTWQGAGGVGGVFERIFAPRALRRLYGDVLARLDREVTRPA